MEPFQIHPAVRSPDMVTKVGAAAGLVARIQQEYAIQAEAATEPATRETLAAKVRKDAEHAIDQQGISIDDYNAVLTAAENDQDLERQLLDAVREVL